MVSWRIMGLTQFCDLVTNCNSVAMFYSLRANMAMSQMMLPIMCGNGEAVFIQQKHVPLCAVRI